MRLSGWHAPIPHLSASSIAMLIQCPEQFRLRKILRITESMGVDRFLGIVDHETHALNLKQKVHTTIDISTDLMNLNYGLRWKEALTEGEPEWQKDTPEEAKDLGLLMMQTYHQEVSPTIQPIRVEERFEQRFPGIPIPVVGYPDVEEDKRIIERKTTKTKLSKPKSKWTVQGRIYSLVYDKPVEYHVITKQKSPQLVTPLTNDEFLLAPDHHDSTLVLIEQAATMLNEYWLRYGPDNPWPTTGLFHDWLCGYCFAGPKYGNYCVAWKGREKPLDTISN